MRCLGKPPKLHHDAVSARTETGGRSGFTLIELLVVIAVIAILAAIPLPSLAKAKIQSQGIYCIGNTHQLMVAWQMYAGENGEKLVLNQNLDGPNQPVSGTWVTGDLTWQLDGDNTNYQYLVDPQWVTLAPYFGAARKISKCPADIYVAPSQIGKGWGERVRSISMNFFMGDGQNPGEKDWAPGFVVYRKASDMRKLTPANAWVLVDEHPDSINDAALIEIPGTAWGDLPASYHNGACGFAFADGHSEIHKWLDQNTIQPVNYSPLQIYQINLLEGPNARDLPWLLARTGEGP